MSDVSGIPNMGFGGGGYFGGNAALGYPAMSAAQINAGIWGNYSPWQAQAVLDANFNNFGQQTDYYSALGAAYGRNVGALQPPGTYGGGYPAGEVTRGQDLPKPDTSGYNPIGPDPWSGTGFDPIKYLQNNPDVAASGMSPWVHAQQFGFNENRQGMGWNPAQYLQQNQDVKAAGMDPWQHAQKFGFNEGRSGLEGLQRTSADFDATFSPYSIYKHQLDNAGAIDAVNGGQNYALPSSGNPFDDMEFGGRARTGNMNSMNRFDWGQSFGDQSPALKDTIRQWGAESGNRYDPELDRLSGAAWSYMNANPDVAAAYGGDAYKAAEHAKVFGRNEGRNLWGLPSSEAANAYMNANQDVYNAFGGDATKAAQHWQKFGQFEGRDPHGLSKSSAQMYLEANPDVAAAYKNDPAGAWTHYNQFGAGEGRGGFGMMKFDSPAGSDPNSRNAIAAALMRRGNAQDMPSGQFGGEAPKTWGAPAAGSLGAGGIYADPFGGYVNPNQIQPGGGFAGDYAPRYDAVPGFVDWGQQAGG
jgi:hypothetical protein